MSALNTSGGISTNRREVLAWGMYDWANSAYSSLYITVFVSYLQGAVLPGESGVRVYGWVIGLTNLAVAVLSPILGAVADAHASKRQWLAGTAFCGATASALMFFATPDRAWLLVVLFIMAQLCMELSQAFYNGFLPEIAEAKDMDRVSALGYGLGYVGGGLALLLFLLLYSFGTALGLPDPDTTLLRPRLGLLLMGLWWGLFTIPTIVVLRDRGPPRSNSSVAGAAWKALREVRTTLRNVRKYRMLALFLLGFLFYNDGVQTVLSQSSVFAREALKLSAGELAMLVLMIQFVAMPGAILVGRLATRWGQKPVLLGCLLAWVGILIAAYFVATKAQFWVLGGVLALVMGGVQSVSRSIMGHMTPVSHTAEFFGFFNLSSKAASMFGPLVFSETLARTQNPHTAIVSLLVFFIIGGGIISRVDVKAGRREALADGHAPDAPRA